MRAPKRRALSRMVIALFTFPATVTAVARSGDASDGVAMFEVRVLGEVESAAPLELRLDELAQFEMDGETTNLGGSSAALDAIWNVAPDDDVVSNAAPPAPSPAQISRRVAGLLKEEAERKAADKSRAPTSRAERKAASKAPRKKKSSRRSPPRINGV